MTIKEMTDKYASKTNVSNEKFGSSLFLIYKKKNLDINSSQKIGEIFRNNDKIFVVDESRKKDRNKKNLERIRRINAKQNQISNSKKDDEEALDITLEHMAVLGSIEKEKIELEKKENPDSFVTVNQCLNSGDDQFFILGVLATYLENLGISTVIEKAEVTKDDEQQMFANNLLQFLCNGYLSKEKYLLDFKLKPVRIEQLYNSETEAKKFNEFLKKQLSKILNVPENDIIITYYHKNDNFYTAILLFKSNFNQIITKELLANSLKSELKNIENVKKELMIETIRLNRSMLDARGNNKSDSNWGYDETRGGEIYYPPEKWHRYGLRVFGKYDNGNNDWLSYDNRPGEWSIAYSSLTTKKYTQSYENDDDIRHPGKKVGAGIYVSLKPKFIEQLTDSINIGGANYRLALMLRIKPDKIRCPKSEKDLYVVNGSPNEIRPYGILLKRI